MVGRTPHLASFATTGIRRHLFWLFASLLTVASLACFEVVNPEDTNPVGTEHTVTLEVVPSIIEPCCGPFGADWEATFEIIEGPNAGLTTEDGVCSPCSGTAFDEPPLATDEANWTYQSNGLPGTDIIRVCVTFDAGEPFGSETNCTGEPGQDPDVIKHWVGGDLILTKVCLGDEDGDADFNILVTQLGVAVAADALDCGEVMVVPGLAPGLYTIQELITGPDAANFLTAISCTTAAGQSVTPGKLASTEVDAGDTNCTIVNAFNDPDEPVDLADPPAAPPVIIVPIDLDNTNTNALNNDNLNDNNNENTNTQEQSNQQEQTSDNDQTTTVNSSPSVVIDFD